MADFTPGFPSKGKETTPLMYIYGALLGLKDKIAVSSTLTPADFQEYDHSFIKSAFAFASISGESAEDNADRAIGTAPG